MSFANPTPLRTGLSGTLLGKSYRVAGRVVMGMEDAGSTYYWNEFALMDAEGESATLVFETTESGGEWRLFTLFEPEYPITAEDAATKRVGDPLNLEGTDVRVTLVDESRVYHIEGEAPEGVEIGDVAQYFNAEGNNTMIVVSWTGDEVECYWGEDLSDAAVRSAFNLRGGTAGGVASFLQSQGSSYPASKWFKLVGGLLMAGVVVLGYFSWRMRGSSTAVTRISAPAAPLTLGSAGKLNDRDYRVYGHALVEISQVGLVYDRHEYQLSDQEGNKALLVYGAKPGDKDWVLFTPLQPLTPLTPQQAAAKRMGEMVNVDGYTAPITELLQTIVRQTESAEAADAKSGTMFYGFGARSGSTLLLARWDESGIFFYRGSTLAPKEVTAAFGQSTKK